MGTSVIFAGFVVSDEGVEPDPSMVESVKSFPRVKDRAKIVRFLLSLEIRSRRGLKEINMKLNILKI